MKATELMIGDWIQVPPSGIRKMKITQLCEDWGDIDDIEPVPVTPEILEKNGFKDIGDDTWQLEEKPYWFWVDFYNHEYGCEFDSSTCENEDTERRLKLYGDLYVHQLQHAMKLCGIEKEIELKYD